MSDREERGSAAGPEAGGGATPTPEQVTRRDRQPRTVPMRHVGRRPPTAEEAAGARAEAHLTGSAEAKTVHVPQPTGIDELDQEDPFSPARMRRAERTVVLLFLLSIAGTLLFLVDYVVGHVHTPDYGVTQTEILGLGMVCAMVGVGAGMIVWAKRLLPTAHGEGVREPHHSPEAEELETEELFLAGVDELGISRRKAIRRTLLAALGLLPLPAIWVLRDLGPAPGTTLDQTAWKKNARLVDIDTGLPIKLGDLPIGGIMTVMPEGHVDAVENPLTPTMLIRLPPGVNVPAPHRQDWAAYNHVAYSKICTHAGCGISLYEEQDHLLLCPCHQSTFDVPRACAVVFGPAARPLPQLPIYVDSSGYFRARSGYTVPVGPGFWERG
jgi:ubiquinol-cytochrome c reductase iron-sulfur subunit